jgi:3-methyladenine DNA glycosylase AlkD
MNTREILSELESLGNESSKKVFMKHGAQEPFYAVKIEDLKKIQKKIKTDNKLALELYNSGVSDAKYLAGMIADGKQMTRDELNHWAENAGWYMISEYAVAWVATEHKDGWEIAMEWIHSDNEQIACSGWSTLSGIVATKSDDQLDLKAIEKLLKEVEKNIHTERNRLRYTMNAFVIAVGAYVAPLTEKALAIAKTVGKISVNMGDTACKVPYAPEYINKIKQKGAIGKKRKTIRC